MKIIGVKCLLLWPSLNDFPHVDYWTSSRTSIIPVLIRFLDLEWPEVLGNKNWLSKVTKEGYDGSSKNGICRFSCLSFWWKIRCKLYRDLANNINKNFAVFFPFQWFTFVTYLTPKFTPFHLYIFPCTPSEVKDTFDLFYLFIICFCFYKKGRETLPESTQVVQVPC